MKITVFASGSKGNMSLVETNQSKILIDAGIIYSKIINKFNDYGVDAQTIDALLITHEHSDHIKGLKPLLKAFQLKSVYITAGTYHQLDDETKHLMKPIFIKANDVFSVNGIDIQVIELSHDANEPVGFILNSEGKKMVILTDTGYVDHKDYGPIKNANIYLLEANHEPEMLMQSKRPYLLKQRILGDKGHLSNQDASWLINELVDENHHAIWVAAHISEDCNTHFHIEKALVNVINNPLKITLLFSSQETLETIEI